jgi:hypothetical protein
LGFVAFSFVSHVRLGLQVIIDLKTKNKDPTKAKSHVVRKIQKSAGAGFEWCEIGGNSGRQARLAPLELFVSLDLFCSRSTMMNVGSMIISFFSPPHPHSF